MKRQVTLLALALQLVACNVAIPGNLPPEVTEIGKITTVGRLPPGNTKIGTSARRCGIPRYCGQVGYVDCGSAKDGPAYYFAKDTGKILGFCGGYCMGDPNGNCEKTCPPPSWKCSS